jgi:hypothetical protein
MPRKGTAKTPFTGPWHIVSMSAWDENYLHEEVQAYIEFEKNGIGEFQFGYVQKQMDFSLWNYRRSVQVE